MSANCVCGHERKYHDPGCIDCRIHDAQCDGFTPQADDQNAHGMPIQDALRALLDRKTVNE